MPENIGFVSTRFAGTDGVSLESAKWAEVLWEDEHISFWYAGLLDRAPEISHCIPEAYFGHPDNEWINHQLWGHTRRNRTVSQRIRELTEYLKGTLYEFVESFDITRLVVENALTIPMHVPLGIAIIEFLMETELPTICHHHDFAWERTRFQISPISDYLETAFPPRLPAMQHVVINQAARDELAWRKGLSSILIPNVLDFDRSPPGIDEYNRDLRQDLHLADDDIMVLQPTRVVPRKGIEHAITLLRMLKEPRCKLILSHGVGDEGHEYFQRILELGEDEGVDIRYVGDRVNEKRHLDDRGRKLYTLEDLYLHADLVTYPSLYEGFGNAFLEAIYFHRPLVINRYSVYARDIEPKGFLLPTMDGFVDRNVVEEVRRVLNEDDYRRRMVEHNFALTREYYNYPVLRYGLQTLLNNIIHAM